MRKPGLFLTMRHERFHIVQIIPSLGYGGAEQTVVNIINYSDPNFFRFSVITFFPPAELFKSITRPGVKHIALKKRGNISLSLFKDIQKSLQELKPDVVHTHLFSADIWGGRAAHRLNLPVVTTEHNTNYGDGWIRNECKRRLNSSYSHYVAVSQAVKGYMVKRYHLPPGHIMVIPGGIATEKFLSIPPLALQPPYRLLFIGRLTKQKGADVALSAFSKLQKINWRLTIVGSGEEKPALKLLALNLGIDSRVDFLPPTLAVADLYKDHHIVLVPSRWEGLGLVAMEAMAAGRVVVGSNVGGLTEVVRDGEIGLLCPPGSPDALAEKLGKVFADVGAAGKIAQRARVYALNNFSATTMAKRYELIYQSLAHES